MEGVRMPEKLDIFYKMLFDCYGIWGWEYDKEMNLLYANNESPYFHGLLLLGRNREQVIREHGCADDAPLIISNSIGTMWAVVFLKGEEGVPEKYYAIGPVFTGEMSRRFLEDFVEPLKLSMKNKWELIECMEHIPFVATTAFFQHTVMLHYYVTGKKTRVSDFIYYTTKQEESVQQSVDWEQAHHAPHINEKKLLDMVRTGNLDYHSVLAEAGLASPGIRTKSAQPVRQAKYSVVAFITLCTRAAIEGGLSSECAYTLSDTYTEAVDNAHTIGEIASVSHTMYEDFIRRVNRLRRESGVSRPIRLCCDYMDNHFEEELELKKLAERVGYTDYYLARKFKAEMGISINAYIRRERVRYSEQLLTSTKLTIEEIGERLHFCSRSYFAKAFREETGMTPGEYRARYRGLNADGR